MILSYLNSEAYEQQTFLTVLEADNSEIRVSAWPDSGEMPLSDFLLAVSSLSRERREFLLTRTLILSWVLHSLHDLIPSKRNLT